MELVGLRIRRLRKAAGLTQKAVADAIDIAQTSLKDIEIGATKNPAALTLIKLARLFEVDGEWLLTGKGLKNPLGTTADEAELLMLYRASSLEGQAFILRRARTVYEDEHEGHSLTAPDPQQPHQPPRPNTPRKRH